MTGVSRYVITFVLVSVGYPCVGETVRGYGPWRLGMSKAEVVAVTEYSPYREVPSTGGVETAKGFFDNGPANVSFVFGEAGLRKIQIWVYEGQSMEEAIASWFHVYDFFRRKYGEVDSKVLQLSEPVGKAEFAARVRALLAAHPDETVKLQMAPRAMPADLTVFSSMFRNPSVGFYVFVYYQQP